LFLLHLSLLTIRFAYQSLQSRYFLRTSMVNVAHKLQLLATIPNFTIL
jgi:hypothetical protein